MALACGRTANSDPHGASGGTTSSVGGQSGGGGATTGGSGPASQAGETGDAGAAATADCPVTPIAGRWVALGPDPYGFELSNDGSHLSGTGCLGGFPAPGEPSLFDCTPIKVLADDGRSFDFVWDAGTPLGVGYLVKMELTLSPERSAMAGKMWSSYAGDVDDEGRDIVLVPYPDQPVLPATSCSGGDPSGTCFLAPLRSDRVDQPQVVELGGGDLLVLWRNQRGVGAQLASSRFDAATGAWQPAEFVDPAPVDSVLLSAGAGGWAMVVYGQNAALMARAFDPQKKLWLDPRIVRAGDAASTFSRPKALFVYDGGDATLITSSEDGATGTVSVYAHDYSAASGAWGGSQVIDASPENALSALAAGSDTSGRQLVVWVRGGEIGKPQTLRFSSRTPTEGWSAPKLFFTSDKQILRPAVAVAEGGSAIVTWQEWLLGIRSSGYSFATNAWSEPLLVSSETQVDNRQVRFNDAGAAVAYIHSHSGFTPYDDMKSVLTDMGWSTPQASSELEASGATYQVIRASETLEVQRIEPPAGEKPLPALELPRCEGY